MGKDHTKDLIVSNKASSSIKKEIFLPLAIGDWTTYSSEKNKKSISITKTIGASNKTVSEKNINDLLFFHQEFFSVFFERIAQEINSHINIESVSVNVLNHDLFKEELTQDIYQCKYAVPELEQIDLIFSKKATKFIAHRLCGGTTAPDTAEPPSSIEVTLVSVVNNLFIECLSNKWRTIFPAIKNVGTTTYGHYHFQPQQAETEAIIEFRANITLFNQSDMYCKVVYSLETIEKLLFFMDLLNTNITDNTVLNKQTLSKPTIPVKSVLGTTTLALHDIQSLDIGDVILLDHQKVTDPIQLIVDDTITFSATPIQIDGTSLGVQILGYPAYSSFVENGKKPMDGPFISPSDTPPDTDQQTLHEDVEFNSDSSMPIDNQVEDLPILDDMMVENPEPALDPMPPEDDTDDGDFSWDELDSE